MSDILDKETGTGLFGLIRDREYPVSFVKNPLKEVNEINDRLNTIDELINNESLMNDLCNISEVLSNFFQIYKGKEFESFFKYHDSKYKSTKNAYTRDFAQLFIKTASKVKDLPEKIDHNETKVLSQVTQIYNGLMNMEEEDSINEFFKYVIRLSHEMSEILKVKQEKFLYEKEEAQIDFDEFSELFDFDEFKKYAVNLDRISKLSILSPYIQLAKIAQERGYVKPVIVPKEENCLIIEDGLFDVEDNDVVPNNTALDDRVNIEVLEGVNYGGKSFDMKKALYIATLALAGSWVPAKYAKVSVRDKIILRAKGTGNAISAFQQDCKNVIEITPPSGECWLIGLDETFTSTEKRGGLALTYGLLKYFASEQKDSLLIISSHYPKLNSLLSDEEGIAFNNFPFIRDGKRIKFPHKKEKGPLSNYKYGITVSEAMGFEDQIIKYANERLKNSPK